MKIWIVVLAAALSLVGCKDVEIKDGKIPAKYLPMAKKLEGIYMGKFNGLPGQLKIEIQTDTPVLTFTAENGQTDLLHPCGAHVGLLERVSVGGKEANPRLDEAVFDLRVERCFVQGRELRVQPKISGESVRLALGILKESRRHRVCEMRPPSYPGGGWTQECRDEYIDSYYSGSFVKVRN